MKTLRNNTPQPQAPKINVGKIGFRSLPIAIAMLAMYCGDKVNNILVDKKTASVQVSPKNTFIEAEKIAGKWGEDKILTIYRIQQGDTLSQIARDHGITLDNILNANTYLVSIDSILHIGDILILPGSRKNKLSETPPISHKENIHQDSSDTLDYKGLTMAFEGFSPRMQKDKKNKTTYFIGHGTDVGILTNEYPFATYGLDVANYFKKKGKSVNAIKGIMHGKGTISRTEAGELFEMRYIPRYQNIRKHCGKHWNTYPSVIQNMLVDMSYNLKGELGIFRNGPRYPGFPDAVKALNKRDWIGFINAVTDSDYANQVGPRRVGAWFQFIVRDLLNGNTKGLSAEALTIVSQYASNHKAEIEGQLAQAN